MNLTSMVFATGAVTTLGTWSYGETITPKIVIGGAFLGVSLGLLSMMNAELANKFGAVILIVAMFNYLPAITYKVGLTKTRPTQNWLS